MGFVFTDPHVTIGGVDLSDHVISCEIPYDAEAVEASRAGHTVRANLAGLKNVGLNVTFQQDYAASKVDATLFPLVGTEVAVALRAVNTTIGATNPEYQTTLLLTSYPPIMGTVGELATVDVTFVAAGVALTRDIIP